MNFLCDAPRNGRSSRILASVLAVAALALQVGCGGGADAQGADATPTSAAVAETTAANVVTPTSPVTTVASTVTSTSTSTSTSTALAGRIQLIGNKIYDQAGQQIIARGPEYTLADGYGVDRDLDLIAATGANAMRVLLVPDAVNGMTPQAFDAFFAKAAAKKMVLWVSFYTWNSGANHAIGTSLGGGNFYSLQAPTGTGTCSTATPGPCYLAMWSRQWVKDLVNKYHANVIIDAMQEYITPPGLESGTEAGRLAWANEAKTHIQFFRAQGYTHPLEIMSNIQGRDLYAIVQHGTSIRSVDTVLLGGQAQTLFGWQAYWSDVSAPQWYPSTQGALLLGAGRSITATQAIATILPNLTFPVQVGFDAYANDTNGDYAIQITQAAASGISWLWWDWRNGALDCQSFGTTCSDFVLNSQAGFAGAKPLSSP